MAACLSNVKWRAVMGTLMFSVLSGSSVYTITLLRFWPVSWWPLHLEATGHSFSVVSSELYNYT